MRRNDRTISTESEISSIVKTILDHFHTLPLLPESATLMSLNSAFVDILIKIFLSVQNQFISLTLHSLICEFLLQYFSNQIFFFTFDDKRMTIHFWLTGAIFFFFFFFFFAFLWRADVDECQTSANNCRFNCKNLVGSFICVCPEGFKSLGVDQCVGKSFTSFFVSYVSLLSFFFFFFFSLCKCFLLRKKINFIFYHFVIHFETFKNEWTALFFCYSMHLIFSFIVCWSSVLLKKKSFYDGTHLMHFSHFSAYSRRSTW